MPEPEPLDDAGRLIPEFDVHVLDEGGWRAVHKADPKLTFENTDWHALEARCAAARVTRTLRKAWAEKK